MIELRQSDTAWPLARRAISAAIGFSAVLWACWGILDREHAVERLTVSNGLPEVFFLAFAVVSALCALRPVRGELDIHDRHVDAVVGTVLLGMSWLVGNAAAQRYAPVYRSWDAPWLRVALLLGGTAALLGGVRLLWRQRGSLLLVALTGTVAGMRVLPQVLVLVFGALYALSASVPQRDAAPRSNHVRTHPGPGVLALVVLVAASLLMSGVATEVPVIRAGG